MNSAKPIIRQFRIIGLALGVGLWGALVLLFAAPLSLTGRISWRETVSFGVSFWALWLFFLPAVGWLSFRFPIERKNLVRNVGLHLLACLLIVGANRAASRGVKRIFAAAQSSEKPGGPPISNNMKLGPPGAFGVFLGLRAALDVLVYGSLIGVCQAITNFRRLQERERRAAELEARLARSQLQALRMQINPHFLFNTLNAISTLITVNPRAADEMLGDLSELLRRSLDSVDEQEIPLSRELQFVRAYIGIEQKRFGERLRVEQDVSDDLSAALVPALILQPLIENAIRHGIEPQREPGLITIQARREGQQLRLLVRDNGQGMPAKAPNGSERQGIGLANTRARLRELYGSKQQFSVEKTEPRGCTVQIQIPFHTEPVPVGRDTSEPA
ncbi:MAG TPA: histidine kinase [Verrucomicrobiae bacterium]|nr:histidine kinase [Verrucomicrobiae bacterium]